jgi:hypothetical protein
MKTNKLGLRGTEHEREDWLLKFVNTRTNPRVKVLATCVIKFSRKSRCREVASNIIICLSRNNPLSHSTLILKHTIVIFGNWDSSVSVAMGYGLDGRF